MTVEMLTKEEAGGEGEDEPESGRTKHLAALVRAHSPLFSSSPPLHSPSSTSLVFF